MKNRLPIFARVNLDAAGDKPAHLRYQARQNRHPRPVKPVRQPVQQHGVEALVKQDLENVLSRRILVEYDLDVVGPNDPVP